MPHQDSIAARLRSALSGVVDQLVDLVGAVRGHRRRRDGPHIVYIGPQFDWEELTAAQTAKQLEIQRQYDQVVESLRLLLSGSSQDLTQRFSEVEKELREWVEFTSYWQVTDNSILNQSKARQCAEELAEFITILDESGTSTTLVVPDTNSLLAEADPTMYRSVSGAESFVFVLLPTVLGELDRLKVEHKNPDVREKAKKVITRIKGWRKQGALPNGVTVDKSIMVKSVHREPNMAQSLSWLDPMNNDDRILASVLAVQIDHPSSKVLLVTGDINLQNKADAAFVLTAEID